jgi:indole-3-glycerol phosphate synthase
MTDVLSEIVAHKRTEVEQAKAMTTFTELESMVAQAEPPRNFFAAVTHHPDAFHTSVIAEVKRRSPSVGFMRPQFEREFDPAAIARRYHANGAAAISCLTDQRFFGGELSYIERIKEAVPLPVLRKDFLLDPWQLWQSRAYGADAVLLIAECLTISELLDMLILSEQLRMTTLLEVHSMENLLRVRPHVSFPHPAYHLLGINNRDLATQTVDINHTLRLVDLVDDPSILVSESGIRSSNDLANLRQQGVRMVLVGESLLKSEDPGAALARLLGTPVR